MQPKPDELDEAALLRRAKDRAARVLDELERHQRDLAGRAAATPPPTPADSTVPPEVAAEGAALAQAAAEAVRRVLSSLEDAAGRDDGTPEG